MDFNIVKMKVNGEKVKTDLNELLQINDISDNMDKVASQLAYWGAIYAAAEAEKEAADAYYRQWRANLGKNILEKDEKLAEWKVRQHIESKEEFEAIKKGIANALHNSVLCKTICDALKIKANMLQSKGAMMRAELDSTGMHTKDNLSKKNKDKNEIDKKQVMRDIYKGK